MFRAAKETSMSYVVTGLSPESFRHLFNLSDEALAELGIVRWPVEADSHFPCRVTLEDAQPGETVLLLNYEHQPADSPFRARHAIFVTQGASDIRRTQDELPGSIASRPAISLRAFDADGMIVDAALAPGAELEPVIERQLAMPNVAYLHAHYAAMGCYAARIDRA
jgi:hypothetical protein